MGPIRKDLPNGSCPADNSNSSRCIRSTAALVRAWVAGGLPPVVSAPKHCVVKSDATNNHTIKAAGPRRSGRGAPTPLGCLCNCLGISHCRKRFLAGTAGFRNAAIIISIFRPCHQFSGSVTDTRAYSTRRRPDHAPFGEKVAGTREGVAAGQSWAV